MELIHGILFPHKGNIRTSEETMRIGKQTRSDEKEVCDQQILMAKKKRIIT